MDFTTIGIELLRGMGLFFLQPLFYLLVLMSFWLGYKRVTRERKNFHTRVYDVIDDFLKPILPSIIVGIILSLILVVIGIVLPLGIIVLFSVIHVLILFTGQARWLSPAYTGGLTLLMALILPKFETGTSMVDRWIVEVNQVDLNGLAILVGILITFEGILILKNGYKQTSPKLLSGKRGKTVGGHEAQRLWIVPAIFLLPAGSVPISEFWPLLQTDYSHVGFIALPFAIGYQQVIRSTLPILAIINYGKRVLLIGLVVLLFGSLSLILPIFIPIVAIVAILSRELLSIFQKMREENETNMYTQRENGLVILGVIPHSPAAKMHAKVGEVITKVNGVPVKTDQQFYEALQLNSAFCKLEIIDGNGEVRFGQTALYDGEHHQIGILFVQQGKSSEDEAI